MYVSLEGELEMTETIQQLKEDIAVLQEKLRKLQEPEMTLKKSGDCDMVSYDHKYYYRLSFGVGDFYWYKRYIGSSNLMKVEDPEEHRLVEELYDDTMLDTGGVVEEQGIWNYDPDAKFRKQKEVEKLQEKEWNVVRESVKWCEEHPNENPLDYLKPQPEKRKIDDLAEKLLPDDHPYKIADEHGETNPYLQYLNSVKEWEPKPQTPEETESGMREAFKEAQQTEKWKKIQKLIDEEDNDKNFKNSLDLIREWGEKNKPPTLTDIIWNWWEDIFTSLSDLDADASIQDLVNRIDKQFIPPSSATNTYDWERCLKRMKEKLR
jgi:hypothetical protein